MNLFEKDFLIVPINKNNSHWYIVIICYPYLAEPVYAESPIKSERVEIKFENTNLDLTNTITNNTTNDQRKTRSVTAAERVSIDSKNSFDSEEADEAEEDDSNFSTIFNNENKENNKICTKM